MWHLQKSSGVYFMPFRGTSLSISGISAVPDWGPDLHLFKSSEGLVATILSEAFNLNCTSRNTHLYNKIGRKNVLDTHQHKSSKDKGAPLRKPQICPGVSPGLKLLRCQLSP